MCQAFKMIGHQKEGSQSCLSSYFPVPLIIVVSALFLAACSGVDPEESTIVDASRNRSIEYKVWLPKTRQPAPLVIISHGTNGHYSDHRWLIEELVKHGYVVAGLNHPKNTRKDRSVEGIIRVWERPPDISLLLSSLLKNPGLNEFVDPGKIAIIGYSAGGQTAVALAGGIYDPDAMGAYCESDIKGADCDLVEGIDFSSIDLTGAQESYKDPRVKAVFVMAPALGPGMTPASLANIDIPVEIVVAADDELVTPEHSAYHYAHHTPTAELKIVPKGGHFVFIECGYMTSIVDYFLDDVDLCGREIDVDRELVQAEVATIAIEFLDSEFSGPLSP
jgi:predicted dienelactone hydrolase